jgi:hypothetical protein
LSKKPSLVSALALATGVIITSAPALATGSNPTASGTLAVTATVASSINMVFNSDASGLALTGAGSNAVSWAFGTIQAYGGTCPGAGKVTCTLNDTGNPSTSTFSLSTPFDVYVALANPSPASSTYALGAKLATADSVNTWTLNTTALSTTSQNVFTNGTYQSNVSVAFKLTVPFSEAGGTAISNTVDLTATPQ